MLDLADVRLILHIYKYLKTYLSKTVMKWERKKILLADHSHGWNIKNRTFVRRHFIQNFDRYFESKIKLGCQQVSFSKTMLDIHYPSTFVKLLLQFFLSKECFSLNKNKFWEFYEQIKTECYLLHAVSIYIWP